MSRTMRRNRSRQHGGDGRAASTGGTTPEPTNTPDADPLAFALRIMRDEHQPMALRASMAKAAMTALQKRDGAAPAPDGEAREPWSDLELARRIAHILVLGDKELADETGKPVENTDLQGMLARLTAKTS